MKNIKALGSQLVETKKLYTLCKLSEEGHSKIDATWTGRDNVTHYRDICTKCGVQFPKNKDD